MKRRTAVRVISFCVTAALIFAGFALKSRTETKNYRLQIQNGYSRSLEELLSGVNNISVILKKAEYTSSAKQMSNMAAHLLTESENAKNALSNLPNGGELTVLNRFLSQVGNYAMSVSKSLADGKENAEYAENIRLLKNTAEKISDELLSELTEEYVYAKVTMKGMSIDRISDIAVTAEISSLAVTTTLSALRCFIDAAISSVKTVVITLTPNDFAIGIITLASPDAPAFIRSVLPSFMPPS